MKRIFFIITFFLLQIVGLTICNVSLDNELFLQGNAYFLQGKFGKAQDCYEKIVQKKSAVWHNMGNCYFNQKNNVKALICWKRAEKNANFRQLGKLLASECVVLEQLNHPCDKIIARSFKRIVLGVPKTIMQMGLLLFLILFLMIWYRFFIQRKDPKSVLLCKKQHLKWLLLGIVFMSLMILKKENYQQRKEAIVTKKEASVLVGPSITYVEKMVLPLGCIVQIIDEKENMIKITSPQGSGWVSSNDVEIV